MKVLTARQMSFLDKKTIEMGTPGITLMRQAGQKVFDFIDENIGLKTNVVVIAGKGNNGGDGFRVAELMALNGYELRVILIGEKKSVSGDALECLNSLEKTGIEVQEINDDVNLSEAKRIIDDADLVVDAIFGTGFRGETEGIVLEIIDGVNCSDAVVVSVDIPSGVNSSTGETSEICIYADFTVTFGCLKAGHVLMPGKEKCGEIEIADIGFSKEVMDSIEPFGNVLTADEAINLLPTRKFDAHKGSSGKIFLIAGSVGLTGAAALSSLASMRTGSGVTALGCPSSLNDIMEVKLTEVMTIPLPEVRVKRCLSLRALGMIREKSKFFDVIAIGPGLGHYFETMELVRRFVLNYTGKIVLDADGINAFAGKIELLRESPAEMIITPHFGEFARLTGMEPEQIKADPVNACKNAAEISGKTVLLKGAPTYICSPEGELWINTTGNPGMATAGMGDVLTGIIASLAAQGLKMTDAAVLGAYIHGKAGDLGAESIGIYGLMSGDVLKAIPDIMNGMII